MDKAKSFIENNIGPLRRIAQVLSMLAIMLLLLTGQFGIDLDTQSVTFFGNHIWPHEIALILLGLALPFVVLAGFSLVFGRIFCGWMCPQTALCELANAMQRLVVGTRSQSPLRRVVVVADVVAVALGITLVGGFTVVSLFVSPQVLLGVFSGHSSTSLLKGLTVTSFLLLVDVALLRHTFCEWMCVVGWWQRLFAGRGSLRVAFAPDRAKECSNCGDCRAACFMRIEPRQRHLPDTCANCGKCITACKRKMAAVGAEGLIGYRFGEPGRTNRIRSEKPSLVLARIAGFAVLLLLVTGLLSLSVVSRSPVQIRVRQAQRFAVELVEGQAEGTYVVDIYNTGKSSLTLDLGQSGLPEDAVVISPNPVVSVPDGKVRANLSFRVDPRYLHPGRNVFVVTAADVGGSVPKVSDRVVFGIPVVPPVNTQVSLDGDERLYSIRR